MSESALEQVSKMTQADVSAAEASEKASLNASQTDYLFRRVVVLRAQLDRCQKELDTARRQLAESQMLPEEEPASDD